MKVRRLRGAMGRSVWMAYEQAPTVITPTYDGEGLWDAGIENWTNPTTPTDWTKTLAGSSTVNQETNAPDVHGGTSACRLDVDGSNNNAQISRNNLHNGADGVGVWLKLSVWAKVDVITGAPKFNLSPTNITPTIGSNITLTAAYAQYSGSCRTTAVSTFVMNRGSACSNRKIYLDDASCKVMPLAGVLYADVHHYTDRYTLQCHCTQITREYAGLVAQLDDYTNPQAFILIWHNGTNLVWETYLAGVWALVQSNAVTLTADGQIKLVRNGTTYSLYYNGIKIGADQVISSPFLDLNMHHGRFSTSPSNTFAHFLFCDDPLPSVGTYARTDLGVAVVHQRGLRLVGIHQVTGHWVYSDNDGDSWTDTGISRAPANPASSPLDVINHAGYVVSVSADGKLYRNVPNTYTGWTDISVPGLPAGTTGRVGSCASNGTYLFYGNYNNNPADGAYIWRSDDDGANWTQVLSVATARHVHSIEVDPADSTHIWATVGDATYTGLGLYVSTDSGATWTLIGSNRYGIDMAFSPSQSGVPGRLLIEGDGTSEPHVDGYDQSQIATPSNIYAVVWPVATWAGTARGIKLTAEGNLFWISVAEGGGTKDGIWMARGPWLTNPVLLEDITGATWGYVRTFESGPYVINNQQRMTKVTF